jgi:hypothetical protein
LHGHSTLLVLVVLVMGAGASASVLPASAPRTGGEAPLTLEEVLDSVREQHPRMAAARQGVATAEAELLSAEGGFDTLLKAKGAYVPFSYYPREQLDAVLEQPLALGGTRLFAGYRLGQG